MKTGTTRTQPGLTFLVTLLVAATLAACTNPFDVLQKQLEAKLKPGRSSPEGLGILLLSFNREEKARTIAAGSVAPSELRYTVTLTRSGFTTIQAADLPYDVGGLAIPDIEPGDWQLVVEGFRGSPPAANPAYRGSMPVSISSGGNPVSITLYRLQEGFGELHVTISWTVDNPAVPPVDNYEMLWTSNLTDFLNGTGGTPPFSAGFSDTSGAFTIAESALASGYYYLTIIWKKGAVVVGRTLESVHIHDTLDATKTMFLPSGSFSSPPPAPANLTLSYNRDTSFALTGIVLSWDDLAYTETGYKVYRTINAGIQELLAGALPANTKSFLDSDVTGLVLGNMVEYHIAAVNGFGESQLDGPASTLYSLSWANGGATAGDPPSGGLVFSGERIFLPWHGNLRGPYVPATGDAVTQRFLGWNDSLTTRLPLEPLDIPGGNVTLTAVWTDDASVLRKIGPAGGLIFYENPNPAWAIADGWLYMEAAPTDNNTNWISGGSTQSTFIGNTQAGVGYGKLNSLYIIGQPDHAGGAAGLAANTVVNGYTDWFLPSEGEASLLFMNLWQSPYFLGQFQSAEYYWTSTELDATQARTVGFSSGDLAGATKDSFKLFRPVRAFRSPTQTWLVRYNANGADTGAAPVDLYHYESSQGFTPPGQGSLTRAGHIFAGWNTQADGSGMAYPAGKSRIIPGGYFVLYAQWLPWPNVQHRGMTSVPGGTFNQNFGGNWFAHTLSSYQLGTYEVTYELWYTVRLWAESNGYTFARPGTEGVFGNTGGPPGAKKHDPVNMISWHDVLVWCNAYSELEGLTPAYRNPSLVIIKDSTDVANCNSAIWNRAADGYRMPTAGEFNHAARWQGGYTTYADGAEEYPVSTGRWWSSDNNASGSGSLATNTVATGLVAWYNGNAGSNTKTVGTKSPNALGIYDMSGNLSEWNWDASFGTNPTGAVMDFAFDTGANRSLRGGSYLDSAASLAIGSSSGTLPEGASQTYGFRVARTTPANHWSINYHANGASSGIIPASEFILTGLNAVVHQNTGALARGTYTFAGWNTLANGKGADFAADGSAFIVGISNHTVLHAKWHPPYRVPKTGVTTITEPGDDGDLQAGMAWPVGRFTNHGDGTITDNLTGLMWEQAPDAGTYTWVNALEYANNLDLASYTDWRLPNRTELHSLANFGEFNQSTWLNSQGFASVTNNTYWSSTTRRDGTGSSIEAWAMNMINGGVLYTLKTNANRVLAVRGTSSNLPRTGQSETFEAGDDGALQQGKAWPVPRFADNGNLTVTDHLTGLTWVKTPYVTGQTWSDALSYANNLTLGGLSDWRLPNIFELSTLVHVQEFTPVTWLQGQGFTGVQNYIYWSSTNGANDANRREYIWIGQNQGVSTEVATWAGGFTWAVRGGE
jgi:formylglycine-generating enzyme required for sulfatase activity